MLLTILFALSGGLLTGLLYLCHPTLSLWWLLPLWIGFYLAVGVFHILWVLTSVLFLPKTDPSPRRYSVYHWFIYHTLAWLLPLLGIRVHLTGSEQLPIDRPFLLVCNHRSGFDPLVTLSVLDRWQVAFVSKPEIFRIPVVNVAMERACFLPIDRENARNAVATIHRAADQITNLGLCMGIYPEGTRNRDSEALLPFHAGSFKIAKLAKCPVAVLTIRYEKRRWPLGMKHVRLQVSGVLDEEYVTANRTNDISARAKEMMEDSLEL